MPLASGADVKIGTREFMLSTDVEEPYQHFYENLYGDGGEIEGTEGKKAANKNILFWGYDDFRRGEGLRHWDKEQPDRWWDGNNNPRIPGSVTSPPTRSTSTTITTAVTPTGGGHFTLAGGNLWYFTGEQGYHSTDSATWTENSDVATELPASYQITAATSAGSLPYFAAGPDAGTTGIWRCDSTTVVTDIVNANTDMDQVGGMAAKDQYLFACSMFGELYRFDLVNSSIPITYVEATHLAYGPVRQTVAASYADLATAGSSVVMMLASDGITSLHEYRLDQSTNKFAGREFWNIASGFTGKKICVSAGILYVLGDYSDKIGLYGYSLNTRQPTFLGYVGEANTASNVRFLAPSYGAQVTFGVDDGTTSYIYVYDAEEDSFSQLDEYTIASMGTLTAGATFKNRRTAAAFATTSTKINRWIQDSDTPAGSWDWVSAAHDFGYPQDEKILLGFHVVADPTVASGTVDLDYQLDEDGSWVDSGTDTAAGSKHTYMQISDGSATKKFRTLRFRMNGSSGARVFSAYARVYINSKQEVWKLNLDLKNEASSKRRPSDRASHAVTLRNYLHTLVSDGNVITFLDGRRRTRKSDTSGTGYTSHTCLIEFPKDSADSAREGTAEVILRSVAPSA